jgi:hypothetical protein
MRNLLALSLACLASACGGNPFYAGDAGVDGGALTEDQACGDNAHAHCIRIQQCSLYVLTNDYGDEGTCETRLKLNCLNALAAPSSGNTAAKSEACALAYPSWSCSDYLNGNPPAACVQATGSLGAGARCAFPGQCQTGFCAIVPGNACGVCAPAPSAGDRCDTLTTCGTPGLTGLTCDTNVQKCSSFAPSGAPCGRSQLCGDGLYCVGSTSTTNGTCAPAVEDAGLACDPTGKTGAGCDRLADLTCNSASSTCAGIQYSPTGGPCGNGVNDQFASCANAATCGAPVGADAAAGETCTPTAGDGSACDLAYGPFCRAPARCIVTSDAGTAGTCQFPNALGCQ